MYRKETRYNEPTLQRIHFPGSLAVRYVGVPLYYSGAHPRAVLLRGPPPGCITVAKCSQGPFSARDSELTDAPAVSRFKKSTCGKSVVYPARSPISFRRYKRDPPPPPFFFMGAGGSLKIPLKCS